MYNTELHTIFTTPCPDAPQLSGTNATTLTTEHKNRIARWLDYLYVPSETTDSIAATLDRIVTTNQQSRPGAKTIPVLTAANGAGKSTFITEWARGHYLDHFRTVDLQPFTIPTICDHDGLIVEDCPVVYVNVDGNMGASELDDAICEFFRLPTTGTRSAVAVRARHALRTHRVQIMIIDDAHFLNTRRIRGRQLLDHIKNLNTELGIRGATTILVGANLEGGAILDDPQINCRSRTFVLPEYALTTQPGMAACQRSLRTIEQTLRAHIPGIREQSLARVLAGRITARVGGLHGDMFRLVAEAYKWFLDDEHAEWLGKTHVAAAEVPDRVLNGEKEAATSKARRDTLGNIATM